MEMEQQFVVEDLFDFPNDDVLVDDELGDSSPPPPDSSSTVVTPVDSACNSAASAPDNTLLPPAHPHFSGDGLCVPSDDLAELEWLSNFVEESFSSEDLQKLQLLSGLEAKPPSSSRSSSSEPHAPHPKFTHAPPLPPQALPPDVPVPGRPRSKRSRSAPCDWSSRLQVLSKPARKRAVVPTTAAEGEALDGGGGGSCQKCLHCGSVKTPQWRTGPLGPKTLCNACGVRYKSGRLVPEYRPAASPSFISSRHSNSHRKVMELRRQKEQLQTMASPPPFVCQKNPISCISDGGGGDFFIRQKMLV